MRHVIYSYKTILFIASFLALPTVGASDYTAYLFAYFTGNRGDQEAIRFALSDDGHTFKALNKNRPVINSASISATGGVRDPHILRGENDDFYMVATDMVSAKGWASNRGLVMLVSNNLLDWQSSTVNIPNSFSDYKAADRVWAPQVIYDQSAGKYMVYFSMRLGSGDPDKIYYSYANNNFTALESNPKLLYSYDGKSSIDADIIYKDKTYYLFFKTEGSGNGIKSARSTKLTGKYVLYDKYLQLTSAPVEGSCVFKLINSQTYILMYDMYMSGKYEFAISTDLKTFSADPSPVSFDFTPRHGTVIPITSNEKQALNARWNPTRIAMPPKKQQSAVSLTCAQGLLHIVTKDPVLPFDVSILNLLGEVVYYKEGVNGITAIQIPNLLSGVYTVNCKRTARTLGSASIVIW